MTTNVSDPQSSPVETSRTARRLKIEAPRPWGKRQLVWLAPFAAIPGFIAAGIAYVGQADLILIVITLTPAVFYAGYGILTVRHLEKRLRAKQKSLELEMQHRIDEFAPSEVRLSRQYFESRLDQEIRRSQRHGLPLCVVTLQTPPERDKAVHTLQLVRLTARNLRAEDTAGRLGRHTYALCLPHTTPPGARVVIERIRREFGSERARFGLAYLEPGESATPRELLATALHQHSGKFAA